MPEEGNIRVFLLDDHEVVRRGIRRLLSADPGIEIVGEAADATEAMAGLGAARADVAVLDVRLPDSSGVEVCRDIRSLDPSVKCLMLTSFADDKAVFDAIMAGASGYVLKVIRGGELIEAVKQVAAGRPLLDPEAAATVLERLRGGLRSSGQAARLAELTDRERQILELIGEGLTNGEIADRTRLAEKRVKDEVSSLLSKLGMNGRTPAEE